jgi:excisionase family DNA binding protein
MRLIKAKQAAEILDVRLPRLYELARTGTIPCVRLGEKTIRFIEDALQEFAERGGVSVSNGNGTQDESASEDRAA